MNDQLITLYDFTVRVVERLMQEVTEEQLAHQPTAGVNPPGWIVGHLALVNDMALGMLGHDGTLPPDRLEAWQAEFGPGSSPTPIAETYPPKDELMAALRASHARLAEAVRGVDLKTLADPNPIEQLRGGLPTVGDLVAHILSTHIAMHAGHLSNWRRQMGHPPLF